MQILKGVRQWPRGRCLMKKPEVKNLVRLSLLRKIINYQINLTNQIQDIFNKIEQYRSMAENL
jgi:hypothetical protein